MGQPLHAFDRNLIEDDVITVDKAHPQEVFTTLFGDKISLKGDELMIRDGKKPVALAGVIGGQNSGVVETTKEIFLESAYFTVETVRRTSRRYGIETDSSYRFTRGVDPASTLLALNYATELILELAGGETTPKAQDIYPHPIEKKNILLSLEFLEGVLGL